VSDTERSNREMVLKSVRMRLAGHVVHIQILNSRYETMKKKDHLAVLGIDEKVIMN
jgi:hypothetical protein